MKLFLLRRCRGSGFYDVYLGAVVCAENTAEARKIHPSGRTSEDWTDTWINIEDVIVEYLGKAKTRMKKGVVCASFSAG